MKLLNSPLGLERLGSATYSQLHPLRSPYLIPPRDETAVFWFESHGIAGISHPRPQVLEAGKMLNMLFIFVRV
jgi:hypothetical protein